MSLKERDGPSAGTLARLIRHPLRAHVLLEYAQAVTSPSRVAARLDVAVNLVSYHTDTLRRNGAIELVRTQPRRGATEHFYRAVTPRDIEDAQWNAVPVRLRRVLARVVIDGAMRQAADALVAGGMDVESTHLSRSYFVLDARGRSELASLLRDTLARANAIDRASRERQSAEATPHELVIMSFERASSP